MADSSHAQAAPDQAAPTVEPISLSDACALVDVTGLTTADCFGPDGKLLVFPHLQGEATLMDFAAASLLWDGVVLHQKEGRIAQLQETANALKEWMVYFGQMQAVLENEITYLKQEANAA